jgi:two-component system chemotaxis response regulator CheY
MTFWVVEISSPFKGNSGVIFGTTIAFVMNDFKSREDFFMEKLRTALVIDSDTSFRQFVTLRLEILGFKVREAETPAQIRSALREEEADLVVTEFAVPGLEGEDLLAVLEPHKRPVFLLTHWVSENPAAFLKQTRVKALIPKKKRSEFFRQLEFLDPAAKTGPSAESRNPQEKHILLIEDSPTIRHYVRRTLEREMPNCVIREAEDGRDAISEMAQKKVDLIITDLQMPGMDGRTFLRMVRKNNLLKQKPVLVFSTSDASDLRAEFGDDSCLEFLPKPASPEQIMEAIGRLLECESHPLKYLKK